MAKEVRFFTLLLVLCAFFCASFAPFAAYADTIPTTAPTVISVNAATNTTYICPNPDNTKNPDEGFYSRLIPCLKDVITFSTSTLIANVSTKFSDIVSAALVLAVITWGILVMTGNSSANISQGGFVLAVKIGAVIMFTNNFGGYYQLMLNMLEDVLNIIATPATASDGLWRETSCALPTFSIASQQKIMSVWYILDCYLDSFIGGIFPSVPATPAGTIPAGILAFVAAAIFSSNLGLLIAMVAGYIIYAVFFTTARAAYIFVTAYIAFSLMVIISIFFIPCILFKTTKGYFDAWLKATINFFLQPIFSFAYLVLFMMVINISIYHGEASLYYSMAGADSKAANFKIGTWLINNSVFSDKIVGVDAINVDPNADLKVIQSVGATNVNAEDTAVGSIKKNRPRDGSDKQALIRTIQAGADPLAFFETGVKIQVIDWEAMAKTYDPAIWTAISGNPTLKARHISMYKKMIFLSFLLAAVIIYIFYSLLEYIPYIGSGVLNGGGITLPSLGIGKLAPPGAKMIGGGSK